MHLDRSSYNCEPLSPPK